MNPSLGTQLPLWSTLPFAGILLSIALFPLFAPRFWHRHYPKIAAFWALVMAVPFIATYHEQAIAEIVHIYAIDYVPFVVLLWALFTVAGGIHVRGTLPGTTRVNVALLATGTILASLIGTTGASMVMIRPVLRANAARRYRTHVVCFFIFLVANVGGALTPLGDPPLFLGFLHGVPFFWVTKTLFLPTLTVTVILLAMFVWLDSQLQRREARTSESAPSGPAIAERLSVEGAHNFLLLLAIMGTVLYSGSVHLGEIPLYGHVHLEIQNLIRDATLLGIGLLSLQTTSPALREKNAFSWEPMREVSLLFAAIFLTMVPALRILQAGEHGALAPLVLAVRDPAHYFWATGGLSSFLDNAPTYLTFFNTALGSLGVPESAVPGMLGGHDPGLYNRSFERILEAISAGAVFMGANSYIGNAPNFMVRSIAEEAGVPMPSFFGYILRYAIPFLIPSFLIATLLFFRA